MTGKSSAKTTVKAKAVVSKNKNSEKKTHKIKKDVKKDITIESITEKVIKDVEENKTVNTDNKIAGNVVFTPDMIFKIFFNGWKNVFNLKGRSSKLEFWCFLLVNSVLSAIVQLHSSYILSPSYLMNANMRGYSLEQIEQNIAWASLCFWMSLLLPLIPLGSMLVRRMHDIGRASWHGYLEQVFMGGVVMSMLLISIDELEGTDLEYTILALSVCFITIFYSVMFYGLKFLISCFFLKGEDGENEFGKPCIFGEKYDELSLKFAVFYFLFIFTIGLLYLGNWYF